MSSTIRCTIILALLVLLGAPLAAPAADSVVSGVFDGSELEAAGLPGNCEGAGALPYQQVELQVSANGEYVLVDAFHFIGVNVVALLYQNNFNANNPGNNLLTPGGVDIAGAVNLVAGTSYVLVVQKWCEPGEGAWAVTFSGQGSVDPGVARVVPAFTSGEFSAFGATTSSGCGNSQYLSSGPVQVSRSGTYYFQDVSVNFAVDLCLQIHSAPFNTNDPDANVIARFDDEGEVELQANTNYYFIVQPLDVPDSGDYLYVLAPPAPFRLNPGLNGSWFNPATAGQGFFVDVFDDINQVFMSWFTYDLSRPDPGVMAELGDPGHRWLTAFGAFEGGLAPLDIEITQGGVFDSGAPQPVQSIDGTIDLEFEDCLTGTVSYDLGSLNLAGVVPIQRIANDGVPLCQALTTGPGMPGEL